MKILVCVKQVYMPGTDGTVDPAAAGMKYNPANFRLNSYDEYALEEALLIKERIHTTEIHAVSVGPERVEAVIKRAMEMGAGEGIHIRYDKEEQLTPYQIASLIASYARDKQYDMIMTGVMAEDDMQMQTGQMIAGILDYPYASSVILQEMRGDATVYVERECDARQRQCLEMEMPCILTIQSGINRPRYPSLSNILRAKQQKIATLDASDLRIPESREEIIRLFPPENKPKGVFLNGTQREKASQLLKILHEKSFL